MKRGLILLLFLLLIPATLAISVTLTAPDNGISYTSSNNVTFVCSAAEGTTTITLYTDISGTFEANKSESATSLSHQIVKIPTGTYNWNCLATNSTNSSFATQNRTFTVSYAPTTSTVSFTGTIPTQSWNQGNNKTDAFDLDDYFSGTNLIFTFSGNSSIGIEIDSDNQISFIVASDYAGNETLTITATDGTNTNTSNAILLNVKSTASDNTAPSIDSYEPTTDPTIKVGESQTFTITKSDTDNDTLTVTWLLDSNAVSGQTGDTYTYSSAELGIHLIKAIVNDGTENTTHSWTLTVEEVITLEPEPEVTSILTEKQERAQCGNFKAEEGENCGNCPLDVSCGPGEVCDKNMCTKKPGLSTGIIVFIVIAVLILIVGGIVYILTAKGKQAPDTSTNIRNVVLPSSKKGEQPAADIDDFYQKVEQPVETKQPQPGNSQLQDYVTKMKQMKFNNTYIKKKLKEQGWSDQDIANVLK